jgi:hypothetical protein
MAPQASNPLPTAVALILRDGHSVSNVAGSGIRPRVLSLVPFPVEDFRAGAAWQSRPVEVLSTKE